MSQSDLPHGQGDSGRPVILALCFVITLLEGYDLQSIGVAAPLLTKAMALGKAEFGYALTAAMIGLMAGATGGGWLGDRIGRSPILAAGCLMFGLGTLTTALAWNLSSLAIFRLLTGIGIGVALPNVMSILAAVTPRERLATQGTMIFVGFPIGAFIAAMLLPILPDLGWQAIFLAGGVPPLLIAPLIWKIMPNVRSVPVVRGERPAGLGALFADGRGMTTLALWCSFSAVLLLLYLYLNWLPSLVVDRGFDAAFGSKAVALFNLGSIFGALALGRLVDRFGLLRPCLTAAIALAMATLWLAKARGGNELLMVSVLNGACVVGIQFVLYSVTPGYYPDGLRGLGSGAAVAVGRMGSIVGPLGFGLLLAAGTSGEDAILSILPFVGIAAIFLVVLGTRLPVVARS